MIVQLHAMGLIFFDIEHVYLKELGFNAIEVEFGISSSDN